jgi:hypothetical protein
MMRQCLPADALAQIAGVSSDTDEESLGLALHRRMDQALHLYHGLMSRSAQAAYAEAYRREGLFTLSHLNR